MSNLPIDWEDKVDSPELVAWLQQFGLGRYINAEQINKLRDGINELFYSSNPDRIISLGTETIDVNEYTYEGYTWQLDGVQINNIGNPSIIVIPSATIGYKRNDISVFKADGTIERIAGTETNGEVVSTPDVPEGTLFYKSYSVDGNDIEAEPEPPAIDGSIYKKKIENTRWKSTQLGTDVVIPFQAAGQMHYSVVNSGLISVAGFSTANLTGPLYEGVDVLFENQTGNAITLKNMFGGILTPVKFNFGADLIVPNGGKLWMRVRNREFELIMKSWSDVNLSVKLDKSTTPSSVYTTDADGFQVMKPLSDLGSSYTVIAKNAADSLPVTGTNAFTTVETFVIPPNTFKPGDLVVVKMRSFKTGTAGALNARMTIGGWIAQFQSSATNLHNSFERSAIIKSSVLTRELTQTTNTPISSGSFFIKFDMNIDWTVSQNLQIAVQNFNAADTTIIYYWELSRIR